MVVAGVRVVADSIFGAAKDRVATAGADTAARPVFTPAAVVLCAVLLAIPKLAACCGRGADLRADVTALAAALAA